MALATFAVVSTSASAQETQSTLAKIQSGNAISIGHRETSVPFSYVDTNNQVIGFSQDIYQNFSFSR